MMAERDRIYFVSDVHLGLQTADPAEREARFVRFLQEIPVADTQALYLLGDIWDFWYEYRDVVPRDGVRVVSELVRLMNAGVAVWFCTGNHDVWTFSLFEELGMQRFEQPYYVTLGGKLFCLGHGDMLGGSRWDYRLMMGFFRNRVAQRLYAALHPWLAYRIARWTSGTNRRRHQPYHFCREQEPLYRFALAASRERSVDYFVFGHFHDAVDLKLPTGARLCVLKDWLDGGVPYAVFSCSASEFRCSASPAE